LRHWRVLGFVGLPRSNFISTEWISGSIRFIPFLHLLPAAEPQLIEEADRRFGWKERNSRKLKELPGIESKQEAANRPKSFESSRHWLTSDMPSNPVPTKKRRNLL
jgi:hypothetical protein